MSAYSGETRPAARAKVATRPEQSGRVIGAERSDAGHGHDFSSSLPSVQWCVGRGSLT